MKGGEKLWSTTMSTAKVTSLEVPVGASLHLFHEGGGKEFVMRGKGDDCSGEGVCDRLESARLEQDVLIGLDQMSTAGTFFMYCSCIFTYISRFDSI